LRAQRAADAAVSAGFRGKTFWDWMQLLIVPLALVVIGLVFAMLQDARQQEIENQRAEADRELAEQRARDEALQAYLDQMSQLMLERKLLEAEQGDPVHTLAQARTSTVILRLDAEHNESVTRFLSNSGLAVHGKASARVLSEITLSHAKLSGAYLPHTDLIDADLSGADLSYALLDGANLMVAVLDKADLSSASLIIADLRDANLRNAVLRSANLSSVDLSDYEQNGIGANLSDANLSGAEGITNEELEQRAGCLKGGTMPNGQKYEEWLKSPREENNGS
jgi:uncharacterized protein YjbI with pentapeptide repeats